MCNREYGPHVTHCAATIAIQAIHGRFPGQCILLRGIAGIAAHGPATMVGVTLVVARSEGNVDSVGMARQCGRCRAMRAMQGDVGIAGTHEGTPTTWHSRCAAMRTMLPVSYSAKHIILLARPIARLVVPPGCTAATPAASDPARPALPALPAASSPPRYWREQGRQPGAIIARPPPSQP